MTAAIGCVGDSSSSSASPGRRSSSSSSPSSRRAGRRPRRRCRPRGRRRGSPACRAASRRLVVLEAPRRLPPRRASAAAGAPRRARQRRLLGGGSVGGSRRRVALRARRGSCGSSAGGSSAAGVSSPARSSSGRLGGPAPRTRRGLLRLLLGRRAVVGHQDLISIGCRLLGRVRVIGARVDLELRELLAREPVAGQHPLDRDADDLFGAALEHVVQRALLDAAGVAGVAVVLLVRALVAGDRDLLGVHDDDEVARVAVRRVLRLASCRAARRRSGSRAGRASARWRRRAPSCARGWKVWRRRSSRREKATLVVRAAEVMIGHRRRWGLPPLRPPLAPIYCRPTTPSPFGPPGSRGAGEPIGRRLRRPGANPGHVPGSADRPREPVSSPRRPTTDRGPRTARLRTPCSPPPARLAAPAPSRRCARPRWPPARPAVAPPSASPRCRRLARAPVTPRCLPPRPVLCRHPPRHRRAGISARRRPARLTPQRGGGGGRSGPSPAR